jgi:alkylhydroperoxidase family enzyme
VTTTPPTVDDALFKRLREHFEPDVIVEMTAICAWENYRARFNVSLGVEGHTFYQPKDTR